MSYLYVKGILQWSETNMEDYELRTAASILASVKEQEARFERLTRALEEECHSMALQSTTGSQPLAWQQVVMQVLYWTLRSRVGPLVYP
ncbi:hypothetical protein GN956_G23696 [Arapaima gigas]